VMGSAAAKFSSPTAVMAASSASKAADIECMFETLFGVTDRGRRRGGALTAIVDKGPTVDKVGTL
jgi:hypothetical protein